MLLSTDSVSRTRRSVRVWAAAAAAGMGLVARGRLLPTVGPSDADVWRAGPLDPSDLSWLRELAAAFPAAAHALAIPGSRPMRLRSPESLVRDLWDAIADTMVRSPAAARTTASPAFAALEPTAVGDLADWLADTTEGLAAGARLGLRIEAIPARDDEAPLDAAEPGLDELAQDGDEAVEAPVPALRLVLQLRSTADPSLIVDAAALWSQPETVLARFGPQAEADLLLALRRGAAVWPPLAAALDQVSPSAIDLDDDALSSLLGIAAEELAGIGIEVLWPSSLVDDGLKLRAAVTPAPEKLTEAGFGLGALLDFRWQLTLDGAVLDAEEIAALAEAKRPLIRLRGRWVSPGPGAARPAAAPAANPDAHRPRRSGPCWPALGGDRRRDGRSHRGRPAGRPRRPGRGTRGGAGAAGSAARTCRDAPPLPAARAGLAGRDVRLGTRRLPGRRHGSRQDDPDHRAAPAPAGRVKAGPTLVVCPASLLGNWEREIAAVRPRRPGPPLPRRRPAPRRTSPRTSSSSSPTASCSATRRGSPRSAGALSWPTRRSTRRTRCPARRASCGRCPRPARIALTGTPVENRLSELWAILDWTTPGLLGPPGGVHAAGSRSPIERYRRPGRDRTARRAWSARSCCGGGRPTRVSRPSCRPRPRPTSSSR